MNRPTVLLLDDDPRTLLVLGSLLDGAGANVIETVNAQTAVRHCEELPGAIDLMVADVILQEGDGPAVVRRVKYLQPQMALLFMSGFSLPELERRGLLDSSDLAEGCAAFVQKPFTAEDFVAQARSLVPQDRWPSLATNL
jgi:CheY-like chemotaxis protein